MTNMKAILEARAKTHGSYERNAMVSQHLKNLFRLYGYEKFSYDHREAMDMIALKLSRILSGQANFADHWDDIAGYATLASKACGRAGASETGVGAGGPVTGGTGGTGGTGVDGARQTNKAEAK